MMNIFFVFQHLTELSLAGCTQISPRMMGDTFSNLVELRSLNLSRTKCNDQVSVCYMH